MMSKFRYQVPNMSEKHAKGCKAELKCGCWLWPWVFYLPFCITESSSSKWAGTYLRPQNKVGCRAWWRACGRLMVIKGPLRVPGGTLTCVSLSSYCHHSTLTVVTSTGFRIIQTSYWNVVLQLPSCGTVGRFLNLRKHILFTYKTECLAHLSGMWQELHVIEGVCSSTFPGPGGTVHWKQTSLYINISMDWSTSKPKLTR